MIRKLLFAITMSVYCISTAQNTVGTVSITEDVYDAYTLISIHTDSYLLNNCGEVINEWNSNYPPGNAVYLLPNGNLLRAGRFDGTSDIQFGGQGGIIELFDWDGNNLWTYIYSTNEFRQHHDVFPMPNGNILILAATSMTEAEAIAAGRDPNFLVESRLYSEQIIEVEPLLGTGLANVVWEWNAKDHLIQDFDATKENFGDVGATPEKLDVNFLNGGNGSANWLHFNSIQYDVSLDQIVASSRNLSELYIIDHSTTTAEAATGSGGTYGKGGGLLYRWGNPQSYRQGTENDRKLFGQHYPHYIEQGLQDAGKLMIFNNGNGRTPSFSEVMITTPPTSSPGVYSYTTDTAYGPFDADYIYSDLTETPSPFYSAIVSSAQRLPNGNILICEGRFGEIFEIDQNENVVWEYINPIDNNNGNISSQGNNPPSNNILFRAIKYAPDFPAFDGRDLTPSAPLELNPDLSPCEDLSVDETAYASIKVYPNPVSDFVTISSLSVVNSIEFYSVLGKKVMSTANVNTIDISAFKSGIYFIRIHSNDKIITEKIVKE